jgi:anti-anti-sigma factor
LALSCLSDRDLAPVEESEMSSPRFTTDEMPERLTIAFHGRLDSAGCASLREALMSEVARVPPTCSVRFDLSATDFVASAFLRLCIVTAKTVGAARFELIHLAPMVREVFAMAGLDHHLRIVEPVAS